MVEVACAKNQSPDAASASANPSIARSGIAQGQTLVKLAVAKDAEQIANGVT